MVHLVWMLVLLGCPGPVPGDTEGAGTSGGSTAVVTTGGATTEAGSRSTGATSGADTDAPTTTTTTSPTTGTTASATGATDTGDPPDPGWPARDKARVFVSGHSLTDNPLVDHVALIAQSQGRDYDYNQQIGIGSPIRVRTLGDSWDNLDWPGYRTGKNKDGADMDVIAELASPQTIGVGERYDTLVITERHDILGTIQWEDTAGLLRHYHDRLIDGNPAGETLFYHSWLDIDKNAPEAWIEHEKGALLAWECVASKVNHTLEADGRSDRIQTLPVGAALVDLVERVLADEVDGIDGDTPQKLGAIFNDNVHLTPTGVYFAALVTYAAVFHVSPVGAAAPPEVEPATAGALQAIAWEFVREYYTAEGAGVRTMEECRSAISGSVCATFWGLLGEPGNIAGCQNHFSNADPNNGSNPFKWPDPELQPWPAP